MKKLLILATLALVSMVQAGWLGSNNDNREDMVRVAGIVLCLCGLRTMVAFDDSVIGNILRVPVGGALAVAGASSVVFAPEIVAECEKRHDEFMLEYYNDKFKRNARYSLEDSLKHADLLLKSFMRTTLVK